MPPWNRTQSAEEILGMKPEELKNKLESAATKEDVKAISDGQAEFKSQLAAITDSLKALTTPKPAEVTPPGEGDDPTVQVLTDPAGFVKNQTKVLQAQTLETQAQLSEMRARQDSKWANVFTQYGSEITESANNYDAATRARPGFWDFHLKTFIGDKFAKGDITPANYPSLLGTSSVAPNADGSSKDPNFGLNPEMASWLKERGVSPEKAARIHNMMVVNGEPINHENYFGKKAAN